MKIDQIFRSAVLTASVLAAGCAAYCADASTSAAKSDLTNKTESAAAGECAVRCIDPTATCEESKKVIGIVQKLVTAYSHGDLVTYEKYLDDKCTMFDESNKKMIVGKDAVLTELKGSFAQHAPDGTKPLLSLTIDQPYAKVIGDQCVVTFVATLQTGGAHPAEERANVTDVFVKRNGEWKKMHWRGRWEVVASK